MIIDFEASYYPNSGSVTTVRETMTRSYASIEELEEEDAHPSFDIWSLGITLYKLMAKIEPYR